MRPETQSTFAFRRYRAKIWKGIQEEKLGNSTLSLGRFDFECVFPVRLGFLNGMGQPNKSDFWGGGGA